MDIEKLIEQLRYLADTPSYTAFHDVKEREIICDQCEADFCYDKQQDAHWCMYEALSRAAAALSTLQAENEKLRADVVRLNDLLASYQNVLVPELRTELEQVREKNAGLALALLTECAPNPDCLGDDEWRAIRAELEQVKQDRDALIDDFVDYVTGGVPNPAIFCKNRCDKCTDMRGWCTGKDCKGFYPSGASGQKEG